MSSGIVSKSIKLRCSENSGIKLVIERQKCFVEVLQTRCKVIILYSLMILIASIYRKTVDASEILEPELETVDASVV